VLRRLALVVLSSCGAIAAPGLASAAHADGWQCDKTDVWLYEWGARHDVAGPNSCVVMVPSSWTWFIEPGADDNEGNFAPVTGFGFDIAVYTP
jgi:hypothetical protein